METKNNMAPPPEDDVDLKIKTVKKLLQQMTCTYVSRKEEDFAPYEKSDKLKDRESEKEKETDPDRKEKSYPSLEIPEEGTSVDPPIPSVPQPDLDKLLPGPDPEKSGPKLDPESPDKTDPIPRDTKHGAGDQATRELETKIADLQIKDPYHYPMDHRARGLFILFNVIGSAQLERKGTGVDAQELEDTFRRMHFQVHREDDPTAAEMVAILESVASYDHSDVDCVAVGILTHGSWEIYRRASDGNHVIADTILTKDKEIKLEELTAPFRVKNCHKSLRGKPKLFFIQACRGAKLGERAEYYDPTAFTWLPKKTHTVKLGVGTFTVDSGTETSEGETPSPETSEPIPTEAETHTEPESQVQAEAGETREEDSVEGGAEDAVDDEPGWIDRQAHSLPESMPIYKDFLIAWSTAPGYFSFRNEDRGSVFIQTLCRYLNKFHATTDLLSILTWCNSDIAHQFQSYAPSTQLDPNKRDLHQKKQMPWYFSRLTKDIVFTPKLNLG